MQVLPNQPLYTISCPILHSCGE
ncbi:hypothetical protein F383_36028 [Gossypium arboreum]|uniref:Uncharacterized protein n=1 Tax=Gossypium arboreum TaxID=29729 RepID=A0A0B0N3A6_GOSAR|nr:hypothetical protein F383_36028 [Gossypium arboreum]